MATVELGEQGITVHLRPLDEVLALHGSLHIPYTHVRAASAEHVPDGWFRGFKIGTNIPGVKVAGTFLTSEGSIFYDFHDPDRCLTLELAHDGYKRVVIEVDRDQDADALAREIGARLGHA